MSKRLKDYKVESVRTNNHKVEVLPIPFENNEATKRIIIHSAKRVIRKHKDEIQALAYK